MRLIPVAHADSVKQVSLIARLGLIRVKLLEVTSPGIVMSCVLASLRTRFALSPINDSI